MKDLVSRMVCSIKTESCYAGECEQCPSTTQLRMILIKDIRVDFDDDCSWSLWKKANNKFDLQKVIGSVDLLLIEMEERWPHFLLHTCCNRQQREHIASLRIQSSGRTFVVSQIDFSTNYTLIRQREVQQGFFFQHQATLRTAHLTIGKEHRDLAIISDYMVHTTAFVYCAQRIIVDFVKKNFPFVTKVHYVRYVISL